MENLIDDVKCPERTYDLGPPILFTNPEIRQMLRLAGAGTDDLFYDLGSGWGQNLIIAVSEFGVRKAIGVEVNESRRRKSLRRIYEWSFRQHDVVERIEVLSADFEKRLVQGQEISHLKEASIVFLGLTSSPEIVDGLAKQLPDGCRLVYYYNCLIPEITPQRIDFPFYLSTKPFLRTKDELEWLRSVVSKPASSLHSGKPNKRELWAELTHDYRVSARFATGTIRDYRDRLKRASRSISSGAS